MDRQVKGILGAKLGMTQVWDNNKVVPVTVVQAGPCVVTQVRTADKDGYSAVQLAFGAIDPRKVNKPRGRSLRQGRTWRRAGTSSSCAPPTPASTRSARRSPSRRSPPGQPIDVTGKTKGKGFAGVMKRHGFHGLRGQPRCRAQAPLARLDRRLRDPGSRLQGRPDGRPDGWRALHRAEPHRPGGRHRRTTCMLVKGAIPGPKGALVLVRTAAKAQGEEGWCGQVTTVDVIDADGAKSRLGRAARPTSSTCRPTSR